MHDALNVKIKKNQILVVKTKFNKSKDMVKNTYLPPLVLALQLAALPCIPSLSEALGNFPINCQQGRQHVHVTIGLTIQNKELNFFF